MLLTQADTTRMERQIAFRPQTELAEGLSRQAAWIMAGGDALG